MLTEVDDGPAAGINLVEWDAVELPSQFMENWCYHLPTMNMVSAHFKTGEHLPKEEFDKIRKAKTFMAGMGLLRQLYFSMLDLELHHNYDPNGKQSPFEFQQVRSGVFKCVCVCVFVCLCVCMCVCVCVWRIIF